MHRSVLVAATRTAFSVRMDEKFANPVTNPERTGLAVAIDAHVRGKIPELAVADAKEKQKKPQDRIFATQFVQRLSPIQFVTNVDPSDQTVVEIDNDLRPLPVPESLLLPRSDTLQHERHRANAESGSALSRCVASHAKRALNAAKAAIVDTRYPGTKKHGGSNDPATAYFDQTLTVAEDWAPKEFRASTNQMLPSESRGAPRLLELGARDAIVLALELQATPELVESHPHIGFRAIDAETWQPVSPADLNAGAQPDRCVVVAEFDEDLHRLSVVLGEVHFRALRVWLSRNAMPTTNGSNKPAESSSLRIAWVQEAIRSVVWRTGVDQRVNSEAHSARADVVQTSREQARLAMRAIAQWWQRHAPTESTLQLESDRHFLFCCRVVSNTRPVSEAPAASVVAPNYSQETETAALAISATDSRLSSGFADHQQLELQTVAVVLDKRGLPHDFVAAEIAEELENMRYEEARRLGMRGADNLPPVEISVRSILAPAGRSFQRAFISNTSLRHVEALARKLAHGALRMPGLDREGDVFYRKFRIACRGRDAVERSLVDAPNVTSMIHWVVNPVVQEQKRNGFIRLTERERSRGRGHVDRRSGIVHEVRDELRHSAEEEEFWRVHQYRLMQPEAVSAARRVVGGGGDAHAAKSDESLALKIGDLWGYKYHTTLSHVLSEDRPALVSSLESVRDRGFVNYFGPQRFTAHSRKGLLAGLHLLRGEFRAAAHVLADVGSDGDFSTVDEAETRFSATSKDLLQFLRSTADGGASEDTCRDAFVDGLGLRRCKQFVNEALTLIWNQSASARVLRHGSFAVLEGDIVRPRPPPTAFQGADAARQLAASSASVEPVYVSKDDVAAQRYTIHDVVLPIAGAGAALPANECAGYIVKALEAHGIALHPEHQIWPQFLAAGNPLGLNFLGGFRYLVERPQRMSWRFFGDEHDRANAERRRELRAAGASWARDADLAAVLSYELPASAYSWSLLREVARSNKFASTDFVIADPAAEGRVTFDKLSRKDQLAYKNTLRKPTVHFGTERMALARIEANIFASVTKDGVLAHHRQPHGRLGPMDRKFR
jgi:tRNA(Glu) U13 pseudouridine synthase TruD